MGVHTATVDERAQISWLYRRVGWGLAPGELDALEVRGIDAVLTDLVDPDGAGVEPNPDPWAGLTFAPNEDDRRAEMVAAVRAWIEHMTATPRPTDEWLRFFWHGHLTSSIAEVKVPALMVRQLRTWGALGTGSFVDLLRAATVDPAMLLYLDGTSSVAGAPNENYGRELMELFALGVGGFTEDDVQAAAVALTGWRVARQTGDASFVPVRHDDTPQRLLGVDGVHDLDTVIAAVTGDEHCAPFVAGALAEAVLGPGVHPAAVDRLASTFLDADLRIRPLVRAVVEAGLDDDARPMVRRPVPWLVAMMRATGADLGETETFVGRTLQAAGQVPMAPPNVAGWPGDAAWLGAAATIARFNLATVVAATTPEDAPALAHAAGGDDDALADLLLVPEGFEPATRQALADARRAGGRPGVAPLVVAMASPEVVRA